jgi:hypothetical protein
LNPLHQDVDDFISRSCVSAQRKRISAFTDAIAKRTELESNAVGQWVDKARDESRQCDQGNADIDVLDFFGRDVWFLEEQLQDNGELPRGTSFK